MKRKLVKHGEATLMVSLPSKWLRKIDLKKGDEVEVEEKDKKLVLTSGKTAKKIKEITIELNNENKHNIYTILTHAYRKGFDRIVINKININILKEIRSLTNRLLLGFEITERTKDRCVLENISEPTEDKYDIMLKKVFMVIKDSLELTLEDFNKSKFNIKDIKENRDLADKFILYCRRLLMKKGAEESMLDWELLTFLMHIEHAIYYMYKYAAENRIKSEKPMLDLLVELEKYFELFENSYYNKDIQEVQKIHNLRNRFQFGKCLTLISKSNGKQAVTYSYLREIFRLIQIGTSPILAEILEKKAKL